MNTILGNSFWEISFWEIPFFGKIFSTGSPHGGIMKMDRHV